jgi:tetratricopeptide (TPR) repeat protein
MPRLIALALALLCLWSVSARAEDDPKVIAEARWKQGKLFYEAGNWDDAIVEFRAAWELVHAPDLLFSIGLAMDKKGDVRGALQSFKKYLELAPNGGAANEAREMVVKLKPRVDALDADDAKRDAAKRETERLQRERDERTARDQRDAVARKRARMKRWTGIGIATVGAVLLGLGAKFGIDARDASNELEAHTMGNWTDALLAKQSEGKSAEKKMFAFTALGGVSVVGGGVLSFAF